MLLTNLSAQEKCIVTADSSDNPTQPTEDRRCGTCGWHGNEKADLPGWVLCTFPLPDWVNLVRSKHERQGAECLTWKSMSPPTDPTPSTADQIAALKAEVATHVTNRLATDRSYKRGWDAYRAGKPWSKNWSRAETAGWRAAKGASVSGN